MEIIIFSQKEEQIMTKDELSTIIESYCKRITYINDCFELSKYLLNSKKEHLSEINEFPAFYQLSLKSFLHSVIIELAKLFESSKKNDSTGIERLIHLCEANSNLFLTSFHNEITECETDKVVESYDISVNIIDDLKEFKKKLEAENIKLSRAKLKGQRDKFYAHLDREYQINSSNLTIDFPLSYEEIKKLIKLATDICNTIYNDLCRTTYVCQTSNWNDINNVFEIIKEFHDIKRKEM